MVSVIIPVFNRQNTLERLFASLRRVTYRPVEFIFVDNGSTDASRMLCETFCKEFSEKPSSNGALHAVTLHCPTPGACAARNAGLDFAHGTYCCFFDSDDEFSPDFLSSMRTSIGDADVCLTRTRTVTEEGGEHVRNGWPNPKVYEHLLAQNVSTQSFIARTDYVRAIGGWADLPIWQDYEFGLRLLSGQYRLLRQGCTLDARTPRLAWNPGIWHRIYLHADSITGGSFWERAERIGYAFRFVRHETLSLYDKRATTALNYRVAIVRGHMRAEGHHEEARLLSLGVRQTICRLLEIYVACRGRGAWRMALTFMRCRLFQD